MVDIILPGDKLKIITSDEVHVSVGPGVYSDPLSQELKAVEAGIEVITETRRGKSIYIDYNSKRYIPAVGDFVVGTISGSFGDSYRVTLSNFSSSVSLSYMAFPNASKKNRPTLKVGDLCYARVCTAEKELEAEIECMDSSSGKDAGFGLLEGGMVIEVTLALARELLFNDSYPLLSILGELVEFEIAIGMNGLVWVKSSDIKMTLVCYKSISQCQNLRVTDFQKTIKGIYKDILQSTDSN